MDYDQWSAEYFLQYKKVSKHIKALRETLKNMESEEHINFQAKISILCEMCQDLKYAAEYLKIYSRRGKNEKLFMD
jgi:hypothetical protein